MNKFFYFFIFLFLISFVSAETITSCNNFCTNYEGGYNGPCSNYYEYETQLDTCCCHNTGVAQINESATPPAGQFFEQKKLEINKNGLLQFIADNFVLSVVTAILLVWLWKVLSYNNRSRR